MANRRNGNRRAAVDGELTHEILRDGDKTIVRLAGDLDFATVAEVMPVLEEACARNPAQVVLDLSRVEFLDSSGVSMLVTVHKRLTANGCSLVVTNPSAAVSRVLELTSTDRVLSITHTSPSSILVRG